MAGKMSVHAFGVRAHQNSGGLVDLLEKIQQSDLKSRVRNIGPHSVRIEDVTRRGNQWFFDFGKFRDQHGPGKASKATPVQGFQFDEGESFCEETACLYIPKSQHLIVQYNHSGTRTGAIETYLNSFDREDNYSFELMPVFDETVEKKYRNRFTTKKLIFRVDVRSFTQADKYKGTALWSALDIGNRSDGEMVEIAISAGRSKKSQLGDIASRAIKYLKERIGNDPDSVPKLMVGITEEEDGKVEMLDLVAHRLKKQFENIEVGPDLRFSMKTRYDVLLRAYNGWKNVLR